MLTPGNRTAPVSGVLRFHFFLPQAPGRGRVESRLTEVLMSNSRIHSFVAAAACVAVVALAAGQAAIKYPQTRKGDQVDSYGGVTVQDPYRWLEGLETPEVAAWVSAQNAVTSDYLSKLPMREAFKARITRLYDYPRTSLPVLES